MSKKNTLSYLSSSLLPWFLLPLQVFSESLFSTKEETMTEIVAILSLICSKEMLMLVPLLIIVGYLLKHYTDFPSGYIPIVEISLGLILGIVYAVSFDPEKNIMASVAMFGGQRAVLGFVSISLYDVIHGAVCHHNTPKEEKMEKKKVNPFDHPVFVYFIAFVGSVLLSFTINLLFHGITTAMEYLRDEAIFMLLPIMLVDILCKYNMNRKSINWKYAVMLGMVMASIVMYVSASVTTTMFAMYACLALSVTFAVGSALWCNKMVVPTRKSAISEIKDKAVSDLKSLGLDDATASVSADYFLD